MALQANPCAKTEMCLHGSSCRSHADRQQSTGRRGLGRVPKELLDEEKDVRKDRNKSTSLNVRIRPGRAAPQGHPLEFQISILQDETTGYGALIFPTRAVACMPWTAQQRSRQWVKNFFHACICSRRINCSDATIIITLVDRLPPTILLRAAPDPLCFLNTAAG